MVIWSGSQWSTIVRSWYWWFCWKCHSKTFWKMDGCGCTVSIFTCPYRNWKCWPRAMVLRWRGTTLCYRDAIQTCVLKNIGKFCTVQEAWLTGDVSASLHFIFAWNAWLVVSLISSICSFCAVYLPHFFRLACPWHCHTSVGISSIFLCQLPCCTSWFNLQSFCSEGFQGVIALLETLLLCVC